ncbi:Sec-independent protein translocase subunit TatA [Nocardiopsis sp. LOL_012]|uniref:Sec-independent protein translocase subunit TatA n=1 Tax=Nocardiopsis sp. LOL_012 TaxID=3345409 RepID=UPI003A83F337
MGALNGPTIAILVVLALLLFGAKKLPDLARSVGRSARILKAESKGLIDDDNTKGTEDSDESSRSQTAQRHNTDAPQQQGYPQLPAGQRIVNESGEPQSRTYGN